MSVDYIATLIHLLDAHYLSDRTQVPRNKQDIPLSFSGCTLPKSWYDVVDLGNLQSSGQAGAKREAWTATVNYRIT